MNYNDIDTKIPLKRLDSLSLSSEQIGHLLKAVLKEGHQVQFRAKGNSMFPFINDSDCVTICPYIDSPPELGDIVAYIDSKTEKLFIHRIISLNINRFIAKGDYCFRRDVEQSLKNILGYISKTEGQNHVKPLFLRRKSTISLLSKLQIIPFYSRLRKKIKMPRRKYGSVFFTM